MSTARVRPRTDAILYLGVDRQQTHVRSQEYGPLSKRCGLELTLAGGTKANVREAQNKIRSHSMTAKSQSSPSTVELEHSLIRRTLDFVTGAVYTC